jgi:hypothetical protein
MTYEDLMAVDVTVSQHQTVADWVVVTGAGHVVIQTVACKNDPDIINQAKAYIVQRHRVLATRPDLLCNQRMDPVTDSSNGMDITWQMSYHGMVAHVRYMLPYEHPCFPK